jgi:hypothetical protein
MVALVALAAGCAGASAPLHFPPRAGPASATPASDDALAADGYVSLGSIQTEVEERRCRGTTPEGPCEPSRATTPDSTAALLSRAGALGAELVQLQKDRLALKAPWTEERCEAWQPSPHMVVGRDGARMVATAPGCVSSTPVPVGTRYLQVSAGTLWRREPQLVPNMLLARAVERGDEPAVVHTLPRVRAPDVYLGDPPLVIAARGGHAAIAQRLLAAGAHAGREAALLTAVKRADATIVRMLLAAGTSADAVDPATWERPLHVAAQVPAATPLLALLLGARADVDALDATDRMPLQHAILACNVRAAEVLVAAGADTKWALADHDSLELAGRRCPAELAAITALARAH